MVQPNYQLDYKEYQKAARNAGKLKYPAFSGDVFKQAFVTYTDGSKYEITARGLKKIKEKDE